MHLGETVRPLLSTQHKGRNGSRGAVLLLHGLYGNPQELRFVGRRLNQAGYAVRIPLLHGCSTSDAHGVFATTRWEYWLDQVRSHFESLKNDHEEVSVGGLCIGADLALALAIERGAAIHSLCLYSTTLYYDGWSIPRTRLLRVIVYYTPLRYLLHFTERSPFGLKNPRIRACVARQMQRTQESSAGAARLPLTGVYQAERLMRYLRPNLHRVCVPTLILHAAEDETASRRSADLVEQCVASAIVRKRILENSYHMITMDQEKSIVAQETIAFLSRGSGHIEPLQVLPMLPAGRALLRFLPVTQASSQADRSTL